MVDDPKIVSFVLRFVSEDVIPSSKLPIEVSSELASKLPSQEGTLLHPNPNSVRLTSGWYSVIRHVQSDTERHLASWAEVSAFIDHYVDLSHSPKSTQDPLL